MKPLADCHLYTFVDTAYLHGRAPSEVARQLCDGGSDIIQLRAKTSVEDDIRKMAEQILPICQRARVGFVVNDHLEIAEEVGADFVHLGQEDFFDGGFTHVSQLDRQQRRQQSQNPLTSAPAIKVGLSTHAPTQCARAVAAGADYVAIGPIYATGTKPTAKPVTLKYVRWAAQNVAIPWFAIGGVNLQTIDDVLAAGARRICVVSAILNAKDIAKTCSEFKSRLNSAP